MQHQPLFTNCTAALAFIDPHDILGKQPDCQGDYEFSYVELIERLDITESEQKYRVRLAPVHIHIGTRMHLLALSPEQCQSMINVKYEPHQNFLAPRHVIFPHASASMKNTDLVYVEPLWQPRNGYEFFWGHLDKHHAARVAPVSLHIDGAFSDVIIRDYQNPGDYSIIGLPLHHKPHPMHACRQRQLLGVLDSWDHQYLL